MHELPIDAETIDRLLSGAVPPADAPPGLAGAAALLHTAASPTGAAELRHEHEVVEGAARHLAGARGSEMERGRSMHRPFAPLKVAALSFAGLLGLGGVAAAVGTTLSSDHVRLDASSTVTTSTTPSTTTTTTDTTSSQPDATPATGTSTPKGVGPVTGMQNGHATFGLCTAFLAVTKGTATGTITDTTGPLASTAFQALITKVGTGTVTATVTACTTYVATTHPGRKATHPGRTTNPGNDVGSSAATAHPNSSSHFSATTHPGNDVGSSAATTHPNASNHPGANG